jgi:hypothetical protein
MKTKSIRLSIFLLSLLMLPSISVDYIGLKGQTSGTGNNGVVKLYNPFTVQYLRTNLRKSSPRLILTPAIETNLKNKLKTDPVVRSYYEALKLNAKEILTKPYSTRVLEGRRLLGTSREVLYRMTVLSMVYRIDKDPAVLKYLDNELVSVCNFSDWHREHFLDVAELSLGVAIAVDWVGSFLPKTTFELARTSLIEKGIKPSFEPGNGWITGTNNWNQVCNGGMIAASIAIAEKDPELAAKTIRRSLDGITEALKQYAPDGIYPEGATYWEYGTSFSVTTSSMLESAFGTDFGIAKYPAFLASADFRLLCTAPSGWYFNYADCGDKTGASGDIVLAWFAKQTGNSSYLEKGKFLLKPEAFGKVSRLAGPGLVWLSQFVPKRQTTLPLVWKGNGPNPLIIFRGGDNDPSNYYFGGKGGKGNLSHGNMDAGSFVFELNNVRWVIDPGVQDYNTLEQTGFDLWNQTQNSQRWSLLTKGNHGHSTLTVNDALFNVNGYAPITDFRTDPVPEATINMTEIFKGQLKSAFRKFIKDTNHSIIIEDQVVLGDSTKSLSWAIMTTSDVTPSKDGAVLKKDGKEIDMKVLSPANIKVSIIMMDPAPLKLDRQIPNLKKVEVRVPAYILTDGKGTIRVRLTSPE